MIWGVEIFHLRSLKVYTYGKLRETIKIKMLINKSKNKGLTLIESLIWFSVFAVVMVSVFKCRIKT